MLSVVLLAVGIVILLWAGQHTNFFIAYYKNKLKVRLGASLFISTSLAGLKSYTASHIMIGIFCFVLGCICCLYFWKRKLHCC